MDEEEEEKEEEKRRRKEWKSERKHARIGCRVKNLGKIAAEETEVQSGISPKGGKTLDEIKGTQPVPS